MANEGQAEGALGFVPGQPHRRVEDSTQVIPLGKFAVFGGDAAGNLFEVGSGWQIMLDAYPQFDAELEIAQRCGQNLGAALRGTADPLQLLFPDGSLNSATRLYQESPFAKTYSGLVGQSVAELVKGLPPERPLRILEIGAGTSNTWT